MMRMDRQSEGRRDCFRVEYSKYDNSNPNHSKIIATFQTFLYQLSLLQNEHEFAFDCMVGAASNDW